VEAIGNLVVSAVALIQNDARIIKRKEMNFLYILPP